MVTVLGLLGAIAVLFGVGVVATHPSGAALAPAERDRADVGLPEGEVSAQDLHGVRFGMVLRGYRMSEVDEVLDRAAQALAEEQSRTRALEARLAEPVDLEPVSLAKPADPGPSDDPGSSYDPVPSREAVLPFEEL